MLNSDFAHKQAALFADRLAHKAGTAPDQRIKQAYLHALGRAPAEEELSEARTYIEKLATPLKDAKVKDPQRAAWTSYLRVLFSGNEFMFVE